MAAKTTKAHQIKEKQVKELAEKIKNSRTLMIISVRAVPARQFQEIKKSLRKDAFIQVSKKNIMLRTLKAFGKESILGLEPLIKENCALAISDVEGFELAGLLLSKKTPVFAKTGQIAPIDIEVKEGPTSLVPGPAISELGALGIQISVEGGKIAIKKSKIVVKQGQPISAPVSALLQKLDIKPFTIGLEPIALYDTKNEKIYSDLKIDEDEAKASLVESDSKALGFAQKIGYFCKETIGFFLAKANMHATAIQNKTQLNKPEEKA